MRSAVTEGPPATTSAALTVVGYVPLGRRCGGVRGWVKVDGGTDLAYARQYRWSLSSQGYARRRQAGGGHWPVMHRELLAVGPFSIECEVDHINGDRLDNRRENLRVCSRAENAQNRRANYPRKTSRHLGVCWERRRGRWLAYGSKDRKHFHVGYFDDEDQAAEAAAEWRRQNTPYATT